MSNKRNLEDTNTNTSEEDSDSTNSLKTPRRGSRSSSEADTPTEIDVSPEGSPGSPFHGWYTSYSTPSSNRIMAPGALNSGPTVVVDRQNGNYLYTKEPYVDENKLTTATIDAYCNQPNTFVYDEHGNKYYIDCYENHRGERIYHPVPNEVKDTGEKLFGGRRRKSRKAKRSRKTKRRRRAKTIRRYRKY